MLPYCPRYRLRGRTGKQPQRSATRSPVRPIRGLSAGVETIAEGAGSFVRPPSPPDPLNAKKSSQPSFRLAGGEVPIRLTSDKQRAATHGQCLGWTPCHNRPCGMSTDGKVTGQHVGRVLVSVGAACSLAMTIKVYLHS
ncbi:hypothetical protein VDGL01_06193 [Verticillium dahliae]